MQSSVTVSLSILSLQQRTMTQPFPEISVCLYTVHPKGIRSSEMTLLLAV